MGIGVIRRGSLGLASVTTDEFSDTSASSAPSAATDGVDCKGFSQILVAINGFTTVSDFTVRPYLYIADVGWLRLTDADGAPVEYATLDGSTPIVLAFGCGGGDRFAVHLSTVTPDGGATYEINVSYRPAGPGL
jgi:hypothetical protein